MMQFLVAAPCSGSGKTTLTCALLAALKRRGADPLRVQERAGLHRPHVPPGRAGGREPQPRPLFSAPDTVRALYAHGAAGHGAAVCEGAMGFYDGLGGVTDTASAWHLADTLGLPVLLVVPAKGASLTLAAQINGLKTFRTPSRIVGVLLNDCTSALYKMLKPMLERETGLPVLGHLPRLPEASIESRHLGLQDRRGDRRASAKDCPSCGCAGAGLGAVPGPDRPACTAGSACRPRPGAHPHRRCAGRSLLLCLRRNAGGPDRRRGRACPYSAPCTMRPFRRSLAGCICRAATRNCTQGR